MFIGLTPALMINSYIQLKILIIRDYHTEFWLSPIVSSRDPIFCAGAILKDRPVCYGTSRLKSWVCVVTRCALLKTPRLKSNKR